MASVCLEIRMFGRSVWEMCLSQGIPVTIHAALRHFPSFSPEPRPHHMVMCSHAQPCSLHWQAYIMLHCSSWEHRSIIFPRSWCLNNGSCMPSLRFWPVPVSLQLHTAHEESALQVCRPFPSCKAKGIWCCACSYGNLVYLQVSH